MRLSPQASIGPFHSSFVAPVTVKLGRKGPHFTVVGRVPDGTVVRFLAQFLAHSHAQKVSASCSSPSPFPSQPACSARLANNVQGLAQDFSNDSIERWLREGTGEHQATSQSSAPERNCLGTNALSSLQLPASSKEPCQALRERMRDTA